MNPMTTRIVNGLFRFGAAVARSRLRPELERLDERLLVRQTGLTRQQLLDNLRVQSWDSAVESSTEQRPGDHLQVIDVADLMRRIDDHSQPRAA
ncbi:MAG: hypothetical protein R3202_08855 [Candidatus Competibacterales bacterium]|nr:hypothetical protein [Candidatus Competibacterales bacterium]